MGGRAVEGTGLENRQGCKPLVGSNPTPSTIFFELFLVKLLASEENALIQFLQILEVSSVKN
jgi:hypothetical protein